MSLSLCVCVYVVVAARRSNASFADRIVHSPEVVISKPIKFAFCLALERLSPKPEIFSLTIESEVAPPIHTGF